MLTNSKISLELSIRELWPNLETKETVHKRRDKLVRQLQQGDDRAREVAAKLAGCDGQSRCGSFMCPLCVRLLREWFICATLACFNELSSGDASALDKQVVRFCAIPTEEEYREGSLHLADLRRLNSRLQERHESAEFPLVFAGLDVSLNEFSRSNRCWQPHVYGIVIGRTREQVRHALSHLYPSAENTPCPLWVSYCTKLAAAVSYANKPYFSRRATYFDRAGKRKSRSLTLKGREIRELAVWLDQYSVADRYLLCGCRKQGGRIVANPDVRAKLVVPERG